MLINHNSRHIVINKIIYIWFNYQLSFEQIFSSTNLPWCSSFLPLDLQTLKLLNAIV